MTERKYDPRWSIFLAMALVVFVFLKIPLPARYEATDKTRGVYEAVESLPPGSIVFISADYGPSTIAEIMPMHEALVYHLLKRDIRIIAAAVWETGPPMIDRVFTQVTDLLAQEGIIKTEGVDYVNLGYKSGQDVAIASIGTSIRETYPRDYRRIPVQEIPLMEGVENFSQIALLCNFSVGYPGVREWLQQVQTRYRVRMIAGVTAVMAPDLFSFFQSGQIEGFLGGLVGAAEYEHLLQRPGLAMSGMNVQSLAHLLILILILAGNAVYFLNRRKKTTAE